MPYFGGKSQSGVWQRIVNLIPPHAVYVEPFFGSGAIFRMKRPASQSIGLDLAAPKPALLEQRPDLEFRQSCGIAFLETHRFTGSEFVYADPPYLWETRRSRSRYKHELTRADHARLLAALRVLPCPVMVSGYPSALYDDALAGWNREEFDVMTRGHTWAREVLWFNYPRPAVLHDLRNVGVNYRDRWRIEKRRRRWADRLRRMPDLERATLLAALVDVVGAATVCSIAGTGVEGLAAASAIPGAARGTPATSAACGVAAGAGPTARTGAVRSTTLLP